MTNASFSKYLTSEAAKTRKILGKFLDDWIAQWQNIDPTFKPILNNLRPYLLTRGKWGRPLLTRLAYTLTNGQNTQSIYLGSAATEVWHRFILCHDDIIDRDLIRHGAPTLEKIYQSEQKQLSQIRPMETYALAMAMESGDLIHALAYQIVIQSGYAPIVANQVIQGFIQCAHETIAGWRLESLLKQQSLAQVSTKQVIRAMQLVSAQYSIVWPLRIGQLFAGKRMENWNKKLDRYGLNVGMAFQIQDDILGIFGDPKSTGKPVGNDLREGKKSLVFIEGYQRATKKDQARLEQANAGIITPELLQQVQAILTNTGAVSWAKQEAQQFVKNGVEALEMDTSHQTKKVAVKRLIDLAYFLADRDR